MNKILICALVVPGLLCFACGSVHPKILRPCPNASRPRLFQAGKLGGSSRQKRPRRPDTLPGCQGRTIRFRRRRIFPASNHLYRSIAQPAQLECRRERCRNKQKNRRRHDPFPGVHFQRIRAGFCSALPAGAPPGVFRQGQGICPKSPRPGVRGYQSGIRILPRPLEPGAALHHCSAQPGQPPCLVFAARLRGRKTAPKATGGGLPRRLARRAKFFNN